MAGLFDKVVVGLNKGVNSVSEGSKSLIEKAKINTQIQDIVKENNQLFANMGMLVFNLQTRGEIQIDACSSICNEIILRNKKIEELQQQLTKLETLKQSYPLASEEVVANAADGTKCTCGHINKATARFCANCGKSLENKQVEEKNE